MKKVLLIAAVAGLTMVSCKKTYVCECVTNGSDGGLTLTNFPSGSYTIKNTKKKSKDDCKAKEEVDGGFTTTCEIK
jgi:hypothetical protein